MEALLPLLQKLDQVLKQGEALAYGATDIQGVFEDKFPGYVISDIEWAIRSKTWTDTQLNTLRNILESVHLQSENFGDQQALLAGIMEKSNSAIGHMQALQQGNALVAQTVTELGKLRQLMMAQINAETVDRSAEIARRAEAEAKGVAWASTTTDVLAPIPANDPRGIGDLGFIKPRK